MPTGERFKADQATKLYVDGNMHEMTREEYIKTHGLDPELVMQAVNKWREEQMEKVGGLARKKGRRSARVA